MKAIWAFWGVFLWFLNQPTQAQQGLKGEYYTGTNFEHKVFTRIDPAISFNWANQNPGPGISRSYYSIRWTGKLLAPVSGAYTFNAKVDDGIRVWVGNKQVIDAWQLNDSKYFSGRVILEAGKFYDLRVDYFNDLLEGEIDLLWVLPNAPKTIFNGVNNPGEAITAQHFFQKAAPERVTLIRKPAKSIPLKPKPVPVANVIPKPPKPITPKPTFSSPLPLAKKPVARTKPVVDTVAKAVVPAMSTPKPFEDHKPGETFALRQVQFEQSSYVLLPGSAAELDQLVIALKENPLWRIEVAGHTDNVGDPRLNLALSENRAKVVTNYLIRHGIADNRLTATGYGGTRPIANNATESERPKNRRVEITIR
ncbi:OmpA family protein [Spirosoma sp. HMF4905]|uniref:OmpA family protein n=1 Tax=Spirosoma arboris TaxID=2682092 RepID=A0A7K1SH43_9BACT|nr:PA14 domain-containing protein [Spirosoma arboris]MVM33034.1 OmpA family protein [Spirosoma arboris]